MYWIIKKPKIFFSFLWIFLSIGFVVSQDIEAFHLQQKHAFTGETVVFSTIIEGVSPTQIDLTVQSLPQNVSFVGSKKEKIYFNGLESSNVELHFVFAKSGTYKISSVPIRIRYGYQYVAFEAVEVSDNPKNLAPKLLYSIREISEADTGDRGFSKEAGDRGFQGLAQGKKLEILVEAQYFASISSFSWQASENSIVFNEMLLQTLPFVEDDFNPRAIPLVRFDFIALEEGSVFFPELLVQGKNWAGIELPVLGRAEAFFVHEKTLLPESTRGTEDLLGTEVSEDLLGTSPRGTEDLEVSSFGFFGLSESEKNAIIKDLEGWIQNKKFLLTSLSYFSLIVSIFFFLLWLLYMLRKKKKIFLLPLALLFFICYFFIGSLSKQSWRIFEGTAFYTIPEEHARVMRVVDAPVAVRVILETNEWAHIAYPILKTKQESQHAWVKKSELRK